MADKIKGLSSLEARRRLRQFGENVIYKKKRNRPLLALLEKFRSPLLVILIAVSVVSFFVGQKTNGTILLFMVGLSVILDFINTYKSESAVEKLVSQVITTATVLRDGEQKEIPLRDIVPDDIIFLSAGDVVPADCQILQSDDFFINQSSLTGESFPVEKVPTKNDTNDESPLNRNDLVFMGTSAVTGFATAQVLQTGQLTEYGQIASRLTQADSETDFEKNIRRFSWFIVRLTFIMVSFVFIINIVANNIGWFDAFIFSIAIAVGLTPELLPVIISVSLSHGSIKMAKKSVIVKNLNAIQNLGNLNILCTDKTGTLTKNHIELIRYVDGAGNTSEDTLLHAYLNSYHHTGIKNPLDTAVKEYKKLAVQKYKKIDEIPFDFIRRRQSLVVQNDKERLLITKGAPEQIFSICSHYLQGQRIIKFSNRVQKTVAAQFESLSNDGFRVLAIASKDIHDQGRVYSKDIEKNLTFVGFVAFLDPAKESARGAIQEFAELGMEIKILTGDNELLTKKICQEINVTIKGVYTGEQISKLNEVQLQNVAREATIFARISPEQKERIVASLRKSGQVVGYLGDGINDAPALKAADVGISVNNAVDVAKETADIILLEKSLRVLKDGVMEGRKTFHNSLKYILMGLSSNFGNMFSMLGASVMLPFLPMLPTQVLLNNFLYDSSQLSLPSDHVDAEDIRRPTKWNFSFIRRYMLTFGLISSVFDFLTFYLLYRVFALAGSAFQTGWFIESIATQILVIYVIRSKKIPFLQSAPSRLLFLNTLLMVIVAWLLPFSPFAKLLSFKALPPLILLSIVGLVFIYLILVEISKRIFYRYNKEQMSS